MMENCVLRPGRNVGKIIQERSAIVMNPDSLCSKSSDRPSLAERMSDTVLRQMFVEGSLISGKNIGCKEIGRIRSLKEEQF